MHDPCFSPFIWLPTFPSCKDFICLCHSLLPQTVKCRCHTPASRTYEEHQLCGTSSEYALIEENIFWDANCGGHLRALILLLCGVMGEGLCWGPFYLIQDFHWYTILDCLCLILSAFMFRVCHNLVFEDFYLISHFLRYCCHQTFLRQCSCKRQDCTIFLDSTFDIDLGNASLYPLCSMPMLHRDSEASFFLRMAVFWSPRHWWFYNDSTAAKLSELDASSPAQGWMLNSWAKLALKFFEGTRPASGFLPLEDCVELAGCKGWVASSFQKQSSMSSNSLGSQTCI